MNTEPIQQGRMLNTNTTNRMTYDQREKCNQQEQSMMFMSFTEMDQGRSREYLATFESPEKCKAFVDNYNELLDLIDLLKFQNKELQEYKDMYEDLCRLRNIIYAF